MTHAFDPSHRPPRAEKKPHVTSQLGRKRTDDYHWMKDENWQEVMRQPAALHADIKAHLEAENAYTKAVLAPIETLKDEIFAEMKGRLEPESEDVPVPDAPYAYYHRFRADDQHGLYGRKRLAEDGIHAEGEEEVLLDAEALAKDNPGFFDLGDLANSRDHSTLAYTVDLNGSENYEIYLCPAGHADAAKSTGIKTSTGSVIWAADNKTLFWVERDENQRPSRVYAKDVTDRQAEARLIYEEKDPGFFVSIGESDSRRFIEISAHNHTTTEIHLLEASAPHDPAVCFAKRTDGLEYSLHEQDGYFYILTNEGGAVDFKIMRRAVDAAPNAPWEDFIAHKPGTLILGLQAYEHFLVRLVRENALPRIIVMDMRGGDSHDIAFDEAAFGLGLSGDMPYEGGWMRFEYSSPTTPRQVFDYNMDTRERVLRKTQVVPSGHNPDDYVAERLHISARDGARVPVTVLRRADKVGTGSAPCLLYGYGSYGITIPAAFRTAILSLVDRGFTFAIAHIRGGMAGGYQWYLDGKMEKKPNTFNDFVDAGRALVDLGYTESGRIVAHGGSAGGLLVGAAVNQAPELFGGVIAAVPFVDVLNTMSDDTLPLTPPEWPEWGNPLTSEQAYDLIASYSPYDNIQSAAYPPMLITGGLTDPRVTYWEPAKWAAKLRDHQTGDAPILLKINMDAGHQGESGRYDSLKETALEYAFAVAVVGD